MKNVEKIKPTGLFTNYIYKAIPLAFDESMSYYETLCGLLSYLKDTVIPALNNNADAIIEVQSLMTQLQDYVDNYFNNLDVQQEINNKLDQMAEDGTLTNLIKSYIDPIINDIKNDVFKINNKSDKALNEVEILNNKVNSVTNGNPLVANSISEMTNTSKIYVLTTDGNWYYYNGSAWSSGGSYQSEVTLNKPLGGINSAFTIVSKTGENSYIASEPRYRLNEYEVLPETQYKIKTNVRGSNIPVVCFFNDDTFISFEGSVNSPSDAVERELTITTPTNCNKMKINSYSTGVCEVFTNGNDINSTYATKTFITYGDSRTWYDGKVFGDKTLAEGITCKGYQYYMRETLAINTYNYGFSGNTTPQLANRLINPSYDFIYNTYDYIVIDGGINDWLHSINIGTIQPIGSSFDSSTVAGALQTMIETIISNNPNAKIFLTAPFTGFNSNTEYTRNYTQIRKDVAKLYSIPILDLDEVSRINKVNKNIYYVDDTTKVTYQLHLTNSGYEFISNEICKFINNN